MFWVSCNSKKKMIVIQLEGGLGNQMFQYAMAHIIADINKVPVKIDKKFLNLKNNTRGCTPRNFELGVFYNSFLQASESDVISLTNLSNINKIKKRIGLNYPKVYQEPSFDFQSNVFSIQSPAYIKGYFQSYKYFIGYEDLILNFFSFPIDSLDSKNRELLSDIKHGNSISIHVRRGDYVQDKITQEFHGNCSLEYYFESIALLVSKYKDVKLIFFSDDSEWVKEHFKNLPYSKLFIDHNNDENSWKDMLLMSFCTHNIIANSSFSWWAAWLNENPHKTVIAPKNWFTDTGKDANDLIPEEWIRL